MDPLVDPRAWLVVVEGTVRRTLFIAILAINGLISDVYACLPQVAGWPAGLDFAAVEEQLLTAKVTHRQRMVWNQASEGQEPEGSFNNVYLELEGGLKAIFRPVVATDGLYWEAQAELSAYRFTRRLDIPLIPPTVIRCFEEGHCGSVQLLIDSPYNLKKRGPRKRALGLVSPKDRSDLVAVQFVLGRWDNTWSNLKIDPVGKPVLYDLEEILFLQQIQYGDFPYLRRYRHRESIRRRPIDRTPFPFHLAKELIQPDLSDLWKYFGDYLDFDRILELAEKAEAGGFDGRPVKYVVWDESVWFYWPQERRPPLHTDSYSRSTLKKLKALTREEVEADFPPPFSPRHHRFLLQRRDRFLQASESGTLID